MFWSKDPLEKLMEIKDFSPRKRQMHKTLPALSRAIRTHLGLHMDDLGVCGPYLRAPPLDGCHLLVEGQIKMSLDTTSVWAFHDIASQSSVKKHGRKKKSSCRNLCFMNRTVH